MEKRISATEARVHFGEVIRAVAEKQETVIIERAGKPEAVMISIAAYHRLQGRHAEDWRMQLAEVHELIQRERGGLSLPPPEDFIRTSRDEWNEERFGRLR